MNVAAVVAGTCVAVGLVAVRPPAVWVVRIRLGLGGSLSVSPRGWGGAALLIASVVVMAVGPPPALVVLGAAAGVAAWFALHRWRSARHRSLVRQREDECRELVEALAASLSAGLTPVSAVGHLAREFAMVRPVHAAAVAGGDVGAAWLAASRAPGWWMLAWVGSAWAVAERSGAPLSSTFERLAAMARADREVAREIDAAAAPARATGALMAALPAVALVLGSGLGSDPMRLVSTRVWVALPVALGVGLALVGVWWIDRIVDGALEEFR